MTKKRVGLISMQYTHLDAGLIGWHLLFSLVRSFAQSANWRSSALLSRKAGERTEVIFIYATGSPDEEGSNGCPLQFMLAMSSMHQNSPQTTNFVPAITTDKRHFFVGRSGLRHMFLRWVICHRMAWGRMSHIL